MVAVSACLVVSFFVDLWGLLIGSVESTLLARRVGCKYAQRWRESLWHQSIIRHLLQLIFRSVVLLVGLIILRQGGVAKSCGQW